MGIIRCRNDEGMPFTAIIFAKSASTSIRLALYPWAIPGQYTVRGGEITNKRRSLGEHFRGGSNSIAFLRNPYARIASRWWEKRKSRSFLEYVKGLSRKRGVMSFSQAHLLDAVPDELVQVGELARGEWRSMWDIMGFSWAVYPKPVRARSSGCDWRRVYADNPGVAPLVRILYGKDFYLGIDWEEPG